MNKIAILFGLIFVGMSAKGQNYDYNPYESLGKKAEVLTLSNGKYKEFHDNDTVIKIGSVMFNRVTNKVVAFIQTDTIYSEATLKPEIVSRWLSPDPVVKAQESPYASFSNNPIWFVDKDGRDTFRVNIREVNYEGDSENEYMFFQVSFTVIQNNVEKSVEMGMGENIIVGMPRVSFEKNGNRIDVGTVKDLKWKTSSKWANLSEAWNENVIYIDGTFQYFHPAEEFGYSTGCFIPGDCPRFESREEGIEGNYAKTGSKNDDITSKEKLKMIRTYYNNAKEENSTEGDFGFQLKRIELNTENNNGENSGEKKP